MKEIFRKKLKDMSVKEFEWLTHIRIWQPERILRDVETNEYIVHESPWGRDIDVKLNEIRGAIVGTNPQAKT